MLLSISEQQTQYKIYEKRYTFESQRVERPSTGEHWNILVYQFAMWYLCSSETAIQKHKNYTGLNGLVLSNTHVQLKVGLFMS